METSVFLQHQIMHFFLRRGIYLIKSMIHLDLQYFLQGIFLISKIKDKIEINHELDIMKKIYDYFHYSRSRILPNFLQKFRIFFRSLQYFSKCGILKELFTSRKRLIQLTCFLLQNNVPIK